MKFTIIEKLIMTVCLVVAAIGVVNMAVAGESDSTGQYCEAKSETCVVRGQTGPNELETPAQIDWDNDPAYEHGGQPPKNAK